MLKVRPIAQLVESQTLDIIPGASPGSSRFGARYIRASSDGDGLRSEQRSQPVEVGEWDGPCPAMWAH